MERAIIGLVGMSHDAVGKRGIDGGRHKALPMTRASWAPPCPSM